MQMHHMIRPKCKQCPRDAKHILEYCDWHWELQCVCQICFDYNHTCKHDNLTSDFCVSDLCPNKAELPPKDPKLCIACFTKVSDYRGLNRCPNSLLKVGVDRCCLCFEFTLRGKFSTATYSTHELPCCVTCGLEVVKQDILEHLPPTLTNIVADYVWRSLEVGTGNANGIITKVDFANGLYYVTNLRKHKNYGCLHISTNRTCQHTKRHEMALGDAFLTYQAF